MTVQKNKKTLPEGEIKSRIRKYCAYQERSHREVRQKLLALGLKFWQLDEVLSELVTSGFLNEERFAKAFAGGKFRMKQWGRNKIEHELQSRGLSKKCIQSGLKEIDEADYARTLKQLIRKKILSLTEPNPFKKKDKVARFAISKGYEPDRVWNLVMEIMGD